MKNGQIFACTVAVGFIAGIIGPADVFFTEEGVLSALQGTCPGVKSITKTERNLFAKSVIIVETYDGGWARDELDSNIFFNYRFKTL